MIEQPTKSVSRRRFLKTAGATALMVGGPAVIIPGSRTAEDAEDRPSYRSDARVQTLVRALCQRLG